MRSGDEPSHARSPLRLRLALALFGLVTALIGAVVIRPVAPTVVVILFLAVALLAAADAIIVLRNIRQGPHFQPGPSVPPYRPVQPDTPPRKAAPPLSERTRMRRYFAIMVPCLVLIVLAWSVVRLYSTTVAVVMSMIAAVLPPIAVIVANFGVRLPPDPAPPSVPPSPPSTPAVQQPPRRPLGWLPPEQRSPPPQPPPDGPPEDR